jgi:hypothetical protein
MIFLTVSICPSVLLEPDKEERSALRRGFVRLAARVRDFPEAFIIILSQDLSGTYAVVALEPADGFSQASVDLLKHLLHQDICCQLLREISKAGTSPFALASFVVAFTLTICSIYSAYFCILCASCQLKLCHALG